MNHNPAVSLNAITMLIMPAISIRLAPNIFLCSVTLLMAISMQKNRWKVTVNDWLRKPSIATTPPTTLYMPKSSTPNIFKIMREVYRDTNRVTAILIYRMNVFLYTRLDELLTTNLLDYFCRDSRCNTVCRNVFSHNCSCCNYRIITYMYPMMDSCAFSNPNILSDYYL